MFNPIHLRSFVSVARAGSFTEGAAQLGLRQSTVSQHIAKLEGQISTALFNRDTHPVSLTVDGRVMQEFAYSILAGHRAALKHFEFSPLSGTVRLGIAEELVAHELPTALFHFRRNHPSVELDITVARAGALDERMEKGDLDLLINKTVESRPSGDVLLRDRLGYFAVPDLVLAGGAEIPLVVYREPSLTRSIAQESLTEAGIGYRIACTVDNLAGLLIAASAGMGIILFPETFVPGNLRRISIPKLPDPGRVAYVLKSRSGAFESIRSALCESLVESRFRQPHNRDTP